TLPHWAIACAPMSGYGHSASRVMTRYSGLSPGKQNQVNGEWSLCRAIPCHFTLRGKRASTTPKLLEVGSRRGASEARLIASHQASPTRYRSPLGGARFRHVVRAEIFLLQPFDQLLLSRKKFCKCG